METKENNLQLLSVQEINEQEFYEHIEDENFCEAYGNPVIIRRKNGKKLVCIAWPLAERMMRAAGKGDEADEVIRMAAEQYKQETLNPLQ